MLWKKKVYFRLSLQRFYAKCFETIKFVEQLISIKFRIKFPYKFYTKIITKIVDFK
ncbi:MAG: hypothetical protein Kow0019_00590 [Methanobacteriaceae archaeon]